MSSPKQTIVSSPGKVLLAGGYLVLDRAFSGLVVATSSRFYSIVSASTPTSSSSSHHTDIEEGSREAIISVRAGQFPSESSTWMYQLKINQDNHQLHLNQINQDQVGTNKFIYITLFQTLSLAYEKIVTTTGKTGVDAGSELLDRITSSGSEGLDIVVLADNDFYSQREQLSALSLPTRIDSLASLQPFTPLPRPIPQTNKTGLGSSAALVTSLVASLLSHLDIVSLPSSSALSSSTQTDFSSEEDLQLVHSLAQFAHCLAQGKVGSGFDISSAVFGTHLYTRFSPSIIQPLMDQQPQQQSGAIELTTPKLLNYLNPNEWNQKTQKFKLPKGLRLILADVDAGTDTPSFVSKVLKWRNDKTNQDVSDKLWNGLDKANMQLEKLLTELVGRENEEDYEETVGFMGERHIEDHKENPTAVLLYEIRLTLFIIRDFQRKMSELSGVPIEPPEQTRLLDACSELEGVIGGGVPGAGGYDALFLLIIDQPSVLSRVDTLWSEWKEMSVCPLLAKQSDGGLRVERLNDVKGLREALSR